MRTGHAKFKQVRHFVVLVAVLAVAACAPQAARPDASGKAAASQPLARLHVAQPTPDKDAMAQILAGEFAIGHGDLEQAAHAYLRAAAVSSDPAVAERAAALALAVGQADAARRAIDRWEKLGGRADGVAQARAELALATGDTAGARAQLQKMLAVGGKDAWRTLGRVLMRARDRAQAGQVLQALATPQRLPEDAEAWLAMSELADRLGRHAYARQLAQAAIDHFHSGETYAWAAQLKLATGDRKAALALYRQALLRDPRSERVRLGYAAVLGQTGRNAEAGRVLARGPQTHATFAARAGFAARRKDKAALEHIYRQLLQAPPTVRDASTYLLGQLADMLGHRRAAIDWYAQVSDDDDHAFDAGMRRAVLLHESGQSARAHQVVDALQADYADDSARLARAQQLNAELYMREKHYADAIQAYSAALAVQPHNTALLYGRGIAHAQAGQMDAAIDDWRALLQIKPHDVDASNALGYTLADLDRDLPEATRLIGAARSARPHDPAIADSWGWLQYRLGHLAQAESALRQAWKGQKDPDVGAHLAEVLWKRGQAAEARRVLAAAHRLDPHNHAVHVLLKKLQP